MSRLIVSACRKSLRSIPDRPPQILPLPNPASPFPKTVKFPAMRRPFSSSSHQSPADYLTSEGINIDASLVPGVLKAMQEFLGKPPTVENLQSFGKQGLVALAASVEREVEEEARLAGKQTVTVHFRTGRDTQMSFKGKETETIKDIVDRNKEELGGLLECACGGIGACSTCHVIIDEETFQRAKLKVIDEAEMDMVDLAWGACETSRLGCQLRLTKECEGIIVTIPEGVHNLY